jgi:hypothetical protein
MLVIVTSIAAAMALLLVRSTRRQRFIQRRSSAVPAPATGTGLVDRLAREIAELDVRMETAQLATDDDRAAYARRRAELKSALARALDEERRQA